MGKKWTPAMKKAAREKRQANAAAADLVHTVQGADHSTFTEVPLVVTEIGSEDKLDTILNLVQGFDTRLEKLEGAKPQFVPMTPEDKPLPNVSDIYQVPEELKKSGMQSLTKDGDTTSWGSRSTDDPTYLMNYPVSQRPVFGIGSQVKLNPDVIPEGGEKTWSEIHSVLPIGTIKNLQYMSRTGEPKYTVVFMHGITKKIGSGFRERELLPA